MFSSISWQLFFTAIFIVVVLYYLFIGMIYYPKEILTFLLGRKNKLQPATIASDHVQDRQFTSIIGQSKDNRSSDEQYFNRFQPGNNSFIAENEVETQTQAASPSDIILIEAVSNLMEGIKTLFRVIKDANGNKNDVITLFPSLLDQYTQIADSKYRHSINAYIYEICTGEYKYDITIQEINDLWPPVIIS